MLNIDWVRKTFVVTIFAVGLISVSTIQSAAQQTPAPNTEAMLQAHLDAGEFPRALAIAENLPANRADVWFAEISRRQIGAGARSSAFNSAGQIVDNRQRSDVLASLADQNLPQGRPGGITEADFTPLIDLIQNTVSPDSWLDTGTGLGTIQAYPAGVFVDATGTLQRIKIDPNQSSRKLKGRRSSQSENRQPQWQSELRKVSLNRLERAAELLTAQGKPLSDTMRNLAGLTEIKFLMVDSKSGDIVIAGPAGAWKNDDTGRAVNVETGQPVLQFDDLIVCLRNAWDANGIFGCAITPRQKNLADTQQYLATTKLKGKSWSQELRKTLGQQDVEVFGIDDRTHAARVLVEADYRMKLIGMGLEPSIQEVPSYLDRVQIAADGSLPPLDVARWWFTLNYDDIFMDPSETVYSFTGSGVQVLSETELLDDAGNRIHTGQSQGPTKAFAKDFTEHFVAIADQYPIYRELKNVFDMALVANLIRQRRLADQVGWNLTFFGSESPGKLNYVVPLDRAAKQVESVMNEKVLKVRKKSSTVRHRIVGVSGGISYNANDAISDGPKTDLQLKEKINGDEIPNDIDDWWWD